MPSIEMTAILTRTGAFDVGVGLCVQKKLTSADFDPQLLGPVP